MTEPVADPAPAVPNGHMQRSEPPALIFLPSISQAVHNSTTRLAEILTRLSNDGPGSYAREMLPTDAATSNLSDGQRISRTSPRGPEPVLDLFTYNYRRQLEESGGVSASGLSGALKRLAFGLLYFVRAFVLVLRARRRAKSTIAKFQLVIGFGVVAVLFASVLFTAAAVLVALGVWEDPASEGTGTGRAADAVAISATALTTWLLTWLRPRVSRASTLLQMLLDYAENNRFASGVGGGLSTAIDEILESNNDREVHVVGYSLGALVAMDYLFPRELDRPKLDPRHRTAIKTLTTIGSPFDFIRLFVPDYGDGRVARSSDLIWTNVFIAADVFGSNFIDDNDSTTEPGRETLVKERSEEERAVKERSEEERWVKVAGVSPTLKRYTKEELTWRSIWGGRGFLSHGGYWDSADGGNCLSLVHDAVLP